MFWLSFSVWTFSLECAIPLLSFLTRLQRVDKKPVHERFNFNSARNTSDTCSQIKTQNKQPRVVKNATQSQTVAGENKREPPTVWLPAKLNEESQVRCQTTACTVWWIFGKRSAKKKKQPEKCQLTKGLHPKHFDCCSEIRLRACDAFLWHLSGL